MPEPLKSADIRQIEQGNRPRARHGERAEAVPSSGPMGDPPAHFTAEQCEVWRDLAASMDPALLQAADSTRFGQLVVGVCVERKIVAEWNAAGCPTLMPAKRGGRAANHPLYVQLRLLRLDLMPLFHEFAMSPLARTKVKVQRKATVSPLDRFTKALPGFETP